MIDPNGTVACGTRCPQRTNGNTLGAIESGVNNVAKEPHLSTPHFDSVAGATFRYVVSVKPALQFH
jgi:hypothetical protein